MDVTADFDVYDHEIDAIQKVLEAIAPKQGKRINLEAFRKEVIGRFEEIGIVAEIVTYTTTEDGETPIEGLYAWDLVLRRRTEPHAFDREQQAHEVRSDLLGLGEGGTISESGLWKPK